MASSGGLSRRRVGGGGASSSSTMYNDVDDDNGTNGMSRRGSSMSNGQGNGASAPVQHAGSAFEGGSKIAFDPRDLQQDASEEARIGGKMPRLTIMEEVLLLGIKDKQGYLSFWNDNISYALRGCILIELALRRRIALFKDPNRRRVPIAERIVEVIDDRQTGETILDEALKMMKAQQEIEKLSINSWIDLMSGETWNVMKIGFQLKQVRERLAKGLVDKGVLRTEKRNFLLFDMATHPVADVRTKESIINRVVSLLTSTTSAIPPSALDKEGVQCRVLRAVCLVCTAYTASVLDNAFGRLGYEEREAAFQRCDEILGEFVCWPYGSAGGLGPGAGQHMTPATAAGRRRQASRLASGGGLEVGGREVVIGLVQEVRKEAVGGDEDTGFELIAGVLEVLSKLDSLL
ncbi:Vacuolar protein sorting-associated protein 74 [Psilocybe cubensis]|uniref:GPP34-domain-containing protein n=2 Tax=Psilocybe cubensis TaxID=181762 RepID=A0A8H7XKH0_PSICU|nr:Vacuolar protein sorting-associated protein 74 [Psilocybe cubensis]KAH9477289.1 Vacuolar protein sorting-associated protein 74 [Psilocybe cubensis]